MKTQTENKPFRIREYNDKAICILGDTFNLRKVLKKNKINCVFNRNLKDGRGGRYSGLIIASKNRDKLIDFLEAKEITYIEE